MFVWKVVSSLLVAAAGYRVAQLARPTPAISGSKVVIVGASSGIGRSLALEYARHGAELLICARRGELLEQVAKECRVLSGLPVHTVIGDITQLGTQLELRDVAADRFEGHVDYLVLNAGAISVRPVLDVWGLDASSSSSSSSGEGGLAAKVPRHVAERADSMMRKIMELNLHAPASLAGLFLPLLIECKARVVVVSSMAGLIAAPTRSLYSASKHAVTGYFNAFRMEVQRHGVSVTIVYPGTVDTELRQSAVDVQGSASKIAGSTKGKLSPTRCAQQILRAAALRRNSLITPLPYWISTVLYGIVPEAVEYLAKKKYGFAGQTTCQLSETDKACRKADLEGILLHQVRTQDTALASQRVVLTNSMKRGINVAPVITAVNRMGALRYANQDSATKVDRRATDMEGFFKRLDRLSVNKLNEGQRYSPAQALK
ncbi:hypothetical protein GGI12_000176 [Dipsacomyces acuminosporus]|nr:hypothetical protein GGI12_000176 [Dipsacomyces acuminosporus]